MSVEYTSCKKFNTHTTHTDADAQKDRAKVTADNEDHTDDLGM